MCRTRIASILHGLSPSLLQLDSRVLDHITTLGMFKNLSFFIELLLVLMCVLSHELVIPQTYNECKKRNNVHSPLSWIYYLWVKSTCLLICSVTHDSLRGSVCSSIHILFTDKPDNNKILLSKNLEPYSFIKSAVNDQKVLLTCM